MAQNREPMTGAERTRAWRERRQAALEAAAKQVGTAPLRDEIERVRLSWSDRDQAAAGMTPPT
jgi:hypothetical protein